MKYILLVALGIFLCVSSVYATTIADINSSDFQQGKLNNTFYNSSGFVQLNTTSFIGNFTSRIFSVGGNAKWDTIFWTPEALYGFQLPDRNTVESVPEGIDMRGNVLLFHFNETSGSLQFNDTAGRNNTGYCSTAPTCPTINETGRFGNSADFDGGNDRIEINTTSGLSFNSSITMSAWIFWRGEAGENSNLQNIITAGEFQRALRITEPDHFQGGRHILAFLNISGVQYQVYSITNITNNNWTYVAVTWNGTNVAIYVNGKLDFQNNSANGTLIGLDQSTFIGAEANSVSNFFGRMDEVSVYNRSLSSSEIRKRYIRSVHYLNFSVRSCDDSSCIGENFIDITDVSPQILPVINNSYFQYLVFFNSTILGDSPKLFNVTINYTLIANQTIISILYPQNISYNTNVTTLNYSIVGSPLSCWYTTNLGLTNNTIACGNNVTGLNSSQGSNTWSVYTNNSINIINQSTVTFFVDSIAPTITSVIPESGTNLTVGPLVHLNISAFDNFQISGYTYSINNSLNVSFDGDENINQSVGNYMVLFCVNDTLNNINCITSIYQVMDIVVTPPATGGGSIGGGKPVKIEFNVSIRAEKSWIPNAKYYITIETTNLSGTRIDVDNVDIDMRNEIEYESSAVIHRDVGTYQKWYTVINESDQKLVFDISATKRLTTIKNVLTIDLNTAYESEKLIEIPQNAVSRTFYQTYLFGREYKTQLIYVSSFVGIIVLCLFGLHYRKKHKPQNSR